jgi:hypothetical protein
MNRFSVTVEKHNLHQVIENEKYGSFRFVGAALPGPLIDKLCKVQGKSLANQLSRVDHRYERNLVYDLFVPGTARRA